jgi:uncharacterized protein YdgA (DUF945 family)
MSIAVGHVAFADNATHGTPFFIKKCELYGSNEIFGDNFHWTLRIQFEQMSVKDEKLDDGVFGLEVRSVDVESFVRVHKEIQTLREMQREFPSQPVQMIVISKLMQIAPALLRKSPEIELTRLSFETGDGTVQCKARISFVSDPSVPINIFSMLFNGLEGEAQCTIPASFLQNVLKSKIKEEFIAARNESEFDELTDEKIDELAMQRSIQEIQLLVAQNYLVAEGESYKANASYKHGHFLLNGQPMKLPLGLLWY